MTEHLIAPYGGALVDLMCPPEERAELLRASRDWPSWDLEPRQLCDLELLLNGGFSPLRGFMGAKDHDAVVETSRLADGTMWPVPITLDVSADLAGTLAAGATLALRDPEGVMLASIRVEDLSGDGTRIGGPVTGYQLPHHYDFADLRPSPAELRHEFTRLGWRRVLAVHTERVLHRADHEEALRLAKAAEADLLVNPAVGLDEVHEIEHYTRVRSARALLAHFPQHTAALALVPLYQRNAGPREATLHAIVRRNYGCSHVVAERGGVLDTLRRHADELGVTAVPAEPLVWVEEAGGFVPAAEVPPGARAHSLSEPDLRARLADGRSIPSWFTFPEISRELQATYRPRHKQGFSVFFTGLSGSGKSTIANVLMVKLLEMGGSRPVTLLDGDLVRKSLSSELGFSQEHRNIHIRRIGYVAAQITKNGGIAICAPIAPYDSVRKDVRAAVERTSGFILVHVATPLEVCEARDRKGLYAKARAGIMKEFTGISDPYEEPEDAELVIDTTDASPEEAAHRIVLYLERQGYIAATEEDP